MKRKINKPASLILAFLILLSTLFSSGCNGKTAISCDSHKDSDNNGLCDICSADVRVIVDFYNVNDLHGKFDDTSQQPGVDELTTFLKKSISTDDNSIFISSGDMWQGSTESNLTKGLIITEWMNELNFASMTLGNHEFDWGEEYISQNKEIAKFPFLAINVFDRETNALVDYATPSVTVECDGVEIGIIGAIGDCYTSISGEVNEDFYFKTGDQLTELVKSESNRLRQNGVDYIVYSLHDGYGDSKSSTTSITDKQLSAYYDIELSEGYVDLVFEGHTHQRYTLMDRYGVYHLQGGGENDGISHVEVSINSANGFSAVRTAQFISTNIYDNLSDDPVVDELLQKYSSHFEDAYEVIGNNPTKLQSGEIKQLVARTYYQAGMERWGDKYDIALGGGFISVRSPYSLPAGDVTYSQLQMLLPFDNEVVLCSIKGKYLSSRFFFTDNSDYYIYYGQYGSSVKADIDENATYYIVTDTYCSTYAPNHLTEVERLGENVYARDLVAEFFKNNNASAS